MANTPNLDLVKPAGTDHALVSVINSNSDKIDGGFGTLSEQIANTINDFGSKTISGMNTAIEGKLSSMSVGESVSFKVTLTDTDSVFTTSGAHTGIATKSADSRINATLIRSGTSTVGYYCGTKTSNGWVWQQLSPYTTGTFTAHLYDYNTKIAELSGCSYTKIGNIYVMWYIGATTEAYNIGTMLQIRNLPCGTVLGGNVYAAGVTGNFGDRTIQSSAVGLYLRPNFTGSLPAGTFTFMIIGAD